jgi:hypothetical protein
MEEQEEIKVVQPKFMKDVETSIEKTNVIRNKIINKLLEPLEDINLKDIINNPKGSEVVLAQMSVIKTLNDTINSYDKAYVDKAKLELKNKANEIIEDISSDITSILPKVNFNMIKNKTFSDDKLEDIVNKNNITIKETELIENPEYIDINLDEID